MESGKCRFEHLSDYDLQILLDEAVELENYEYAAAIKHEQVRRKEQLWEPPKTTTMGGIRAFLFPKSEEMLLSDADYSMKEIAHAFGINPELFGIPAKHNAPEGKTIAHRFKNVPFALYSLIGNYIVKSHILYFGTDVLIDSAGHINFTIEVPNSTEGIREMEQFLRIFFPES